MQNGSLSPSLYLQPDNRQHSTYWAAEGHDLPLQFEQHITYDTYLPLKAVWMRFHPR